MMGSGYRSNAACSLSRIKQGGERCGNLLSDKERIIAARYDEGG